MSRFLDLVAGQRPHEKQLLPVCDTYSSKSSGLEIIPKWGISVHFLVNGQLLLLLRKDNYNCDLWVLLLCTKKALLVLRTMLQSGHWYLNVYGKCFDSIWFLKFPWWFVLKVKQTPQYFEPCASFLTYWSKSSNVCRFPVKRACLVNLFAFIVGHSDVIVDSTFGNTFFSANRASILEHARIMNALNVIACSNSAGKPLLAYLTRVLVFVWVKPVFLNNKLKQILRFGEIQGRS